MNNIYNVFWNQLLDPDNVMPLTHKTVHWFARTLTRRNLWYKDTVTENMLEKTQFIVVLGNVSVVALVHSANRLCGLRLDVEKGGKSVETCQGEPLIFGGAWQWTSSHLPCETLNHLAAWHNSSKAPLLAQCARKNPDSVCKSGAEVSLRWFPRPWFIAPSAPRTLVL